ncbi:MAG: hypothetical protein B7Z37_18150 [Verrucomicrobia bacterium 12-59-8]|nr:MAG: hypothetical protein B7Z37_18150 [Verrucomicrobia bacterium 12-59-8]
MYRHEFGLEIRLNFYTIAHAHKKIGDGLFPELFSIAAMFSQDDQTASSEPEMTNNAERSKNETRQMAIQDCLAKQPPEALEEFELLSTTDRPFHAHPSAANRRSRPWPKGYVFASIVMAGVCGYLLGINHRPSASPTGRPSAASSSATAPATELVALPGGRFSMGDTMDGSKDARPHQVSLAPFMMAQHEVTLELWTNVMLWGRDQGYPDLPPGSGKTNDHPVYGISWNDAVKWCNALSEKEGLTPCYYTEATRQTIARKGAADIGNQQVYWQANGYRLPTEAEWELGARGGLAGKRFPWGNEITHKQANYHGSTHIDYDKSQRNGPAAALMSSPPCTAAIGSFPPNEFSLYDMAGNVAEWCWDFYDESYGAPMPLLNNPHGPDTGKTCVVRGGSWRHTAAAARCASRFSLAGDQTASYVGFRVVRGR